MASHHKSFAATPFAREVAEKIAIVLTPSRENPHPDFYQAGLILEDARQTWIQTANLTPDQWMDEAIANLPGVPDDMLGNLEKFADIYLVQHLILRAPFGLDEFPMIGAIRQGKLARSLRNVGITWPRPKPD